jgi:carboxypeptidase C (cathepsin A)
VQDCATATKQFLLLAEDFICNVKGNQAWVESLQWMQHQAFKNATEEPWTIDGEIVGSRKSAGLLSFIKVFQSGQH